MLSWRRPRPLAGKLQGWQEESVRANVAPADVGFSALGHPRCLSYVVTGRHLFFSPFATLILTLFSSEFHEHHFLASTLLSHVFEMLENRDPDRRSRAIATLRNLLAAHDSDPRLQHRAQRERMASLYFPFIVHLQSIQPRLRRPNTKLLKETRETGWLFSEAETRDLLLCFIFILKNYNGAWLHMHWQETGLTPALFSILSLCLETFQYKGRARIFRRMMDAPLEKHKAMKMLEEHYVASGTGTPMQGTVKRPHSTMSMRTPATWRNSRAGSTLSNSSWSASIMRSQSPTVPLSAASSQQSSSESVMRAPSKTRFRISTFSGASARQAPSLSPTELEAVALYEANLAHEVNIVVLGVAEQILSFTEDIERDGGSNMAAQRTVNLLLAFLQNGPSESFLPVLFGTLRFFVGAFRGVFFNPATDYCQSMCSQILRACNASMGALHSHAIVFLYYLLQLDLERMSQALMVAVSKIAGLSDDRSDAKLRDALERISELATMDRDAKGDFPQRVQDLMARVRTVLVNTVQLKKYSNDPEMLVDLQYDVADSYNNSPQLRLTWLESMASIHTREGHWSEAAMCVIHCAGIIAEQLKHRKGSIVEMQGLRALLPVTANVTSEGALASDAAKAATLYATPIFTDRGLVHVLEVAITFLKRAKRYELVSSLYNLFLPTLERRRDYRRLASATEDMHGCFAQILELERTKRRHLGKYYRVAFFGKHFGALNGKEYIYKEPDVSIVTMEAPLFLNLFFLHFDIDPG